MAKWQVGEKRIAEKMSSEFGHFIELIKFNLQDFN